MARRPQKQLAFAFFDGSASAKKALASFLEDESFSKRPGCSVGLLATSQPGEVDALTLGITEGKDGPQVGAILGLIALAYSGRMTERTGPFLDTQSDLSYDDVARIGAELDSGGAAIAILADPPSVERAVVALARLGGRAEVHTLSRGALERAGSLL